VVHNGFYTSMEALKGATYEELVDSGVRPVHAKLIISHLGSRTPMPGTPMPQGGAQDAEGKAEEVTTFLRSVGLENCQPALTEAGYTSLDSLGEAGMQELLAAGLKPVHARLIVSNLDSASTAGINMTPLNQRVISLDEETLLGAPKQRKSHRARWYAGGLVVMLLLLFVAPKLFGGGGAEAGAKGHGEGKHVHAFGAAKGKAHPATPADAADAAGGVKMATPAHKGKAGGAKGKGNVKTVEDRDV